MARENSSQFLENVQTFSKSFQTFENNFSESKSTCQFDQHVHLVIVQSVDICTYPFAHAETTQSA